MSQTLFLIKIHAAALNRDQESDSLFQKGSAVYGHPQEETYGSICIIYCTVQFLYNNDGDTSDDAAPDDDISFQLLVMYLLFAVRLLLDIHPCDILSYIFNLIFTVVIFQDSVRHLLSLFEMGVNR